MALKIFEVGRKEKKLIGKKMSVTVEHKQKSDSDRDAKMTFPASEAQESWLTQLFRLHRLAQILLQVGSI